MKETTRRDIEEFLDLDDPIVEPGTKNDGNKEQPGEYRCKSLPIGKILDPEPDRELDHDVVSSMVKSARTIGILHPIAVRKIQTKRKGKLRTKTVLVAGAHRLEAARCLRYERIDCIYIDYDDDTTVKLVQIGEDLFRKHLTILRGAELFAKWYELVSKDNVYGQVDWKNKLGRPPSGVSKIARDVPLGGSTEAKRKMIYAQDELRAFNQKPNRQRSMLACTTISKLYSRLPRQMAERRN